MKVWIDTDSGTWGGMDNDPIRIVDLTEVARKDSLAGEPVDEYSLLAFLESETDSEIAYFGQINGRKAK